MVVRGGFDDCIDGCWADASSTGNSMVPMTLAHTNGGYDIRYLYTTHIASFWVAVDSVFVYVLL